MSQKWDENESSIWNVKLIDKNPKSGKKLIENRCKWTNIRLKCQTSGFNGETVIQLKSGNFGFKKQSELGNEVAVTVWTASSLEILTITRNN